MNSQTRKAVILGYGWSGTLSPRDAARRFKSSLGSVGASAVVARCEPLRLRFCRVDAVLQGQPLAVLITSLRGKTVASILDLSLYLPPTRRWLKAEIID